LETLVVVVVVVEDAPHFEDRLRILGSLLRLE
jgi:hypothetical protein